MILEKKTTWGLDYIVAKRHSGVMIEIYWETCFIQLPKQDIECMLKEINEVESRLGD